MGLGEYCGYDDDIYVVSAFYEFAGIKPLFEQGCQLSVGALGLQISDLNQFYGRGLCQCHILGCELSLPVLCFPKTLVET